MLMKESNRNIYKIYPVSFWRKAISKGFFEGYGIDIKDGYIHFSTANQLEKTLELHFKKSMNLCLLQVLTKGLKVKWEKSSSGVFFPHLYEVLDIKKVINIIILKTSTNGNYILPKLG